MGFFSGMKKVLSGVASFVGAPVKGMTTIIQSAIDHNDNWKVGLGEMFIPGYAVKTAIDEINNPNSLEYVSSDDKEVIESIKSIDINNDGVTFGVHVDNIIDYFEDKYGIDTPLGTDRQSDLENNKSKSGSWLLGAIPLALGLFFLL